MRESAQALQPGLPSTGDETLDSLSSLGGPSVLRPVGDKLSLDPVALRPLPSESGERDAGATLASEIGSGWQVAVRSDPERPSRDDAALAAFQPRTGDPLSRYELLGMLGQGGMGEVWRVRDRDLNRIMALKVVRPDRAPSERMLARFIEEAQATAQLQHPGIVPVHELGRMADGRFYFTMKEVRGRTMGEIIADVHAAAAGGTWESSPGGWTFRRLIEAFHRSCEAVAYAHARGVIHRDLKPSNIMLGDFGEVLVLDWGLAKVMGRPDRAAADGRLDLVITDRSQDASEATRAGEVAGTPAYMSPEQARGEIDQIGPPSDVYALGAVLFHILAGKPPFRGPFLVLLAQVAAGNLPVPTAPAPLPAELVALSRAAMATDRKARFAHAGELADEVAAWLDGARRREQALAAVAQADARKPEIADLRASAARARADAAALLDGVPPSDPVERKRPAWARLAAAAALDREAHLGEVEYLQTLRSALNHWPDLVEAHDRLADHYQAEHAAAEARRDTDGALGAEALLRVHDRGRYAAYLRGEGTLSLVTDPPGAEVSLYSYEVQDQRLVPVFDRALGVTPLREVPVAMGSYLCLLRAPGCAEVRYPISLGRLERWCGARPEENAPSPVALPPAGALGPDDCYVPAGWTWSGGDEAIQKHKLPRRRIWLNPFILRRFPVTNAEYIAFLDDLVASGREEEALVAAPRERGAGGQLGPLIYGRRPDGTFFLKPDAEGDLWQPDWPVIMIDWHCAEAYARWWAAQTGHPWRLPHELEWEKAARGVDGRIYPWGDDLDPTFCNMMASYPTGPRLCAVQDFSKDESPYGVRGMAGNILTWTATSYAQEGPPIDAYGLVRTDPEQNSLQVSARGGAFGWSAQYCRSDFRTFWTRLARQWDTGLRLCRSWPG